MTTTARCPGEVIDRARQWVPAYPLRGDLVAILAVVVAMRVVFPDRADWAAHVMAGGAVAVVADAVLGRRVGGWGVTLGATAALVFAVLGELTVAGPFDPGDVAFTLAGALVVTGGASMLPDGSAADARLWRRALVWGLGLLAFAVYFRYGIRRGP